MKSTPQLAAITAALFLTAASFAQTPPPIPVPSQFTTAKTVFLASGAAIAAGAQDPLVSRELYTAMATALIKDGHYHLVAAPADADLSMVVSAVAFVTDVSRGSGTSYAFVRLAIYDTKTNALLWTIEEPVNIYLQQKDIGKVVPEVITDLDSLAASKVP